MLAKLGEELVVVYLLCVKYNPVDDDLFDKIYEIFRKFEPVAKEEGVTSPLDVKLVISHIDIIRCADTLLYSIVVVLFRPSFTLFIFNLQDCGSFAITCRERLQSGTHEE